MSTELIRVTDRQLLFQLWFCTARHFREVNVDYVTTGAKIGLKSHKFVKLLWNWKSYFELQLPPFHPPPCPLNPISIPLGCCWGCRNIRSPLANYCPARTCDLRQEESSLQALVLGAGGVWSLVSCLPPPNLIYQGHLKMYDIFTVPILKSSTMWVKDRCRGFFYSIPVSGGSVFLIPPLAAYLKLLLFPLRVRLYPLISSAYR